MSWRDIRDNGVGREVNCNCDAAAFKFEFIFELEKKVASNLGKYSYCLVSRVLDAIPDATWAAQ